MISKFFIDRPVFASVLSIVLVLAGLMALRSLPIAEYPDLTPPQIVVTASYPGASAEVVAQTVAAPIEEQINGVEGMLYANSTSTSTGSLTITVTFEVGTDPDQATIDVNNRIQRILSTLPEEVRRLGVQARKQSSQILYVIGLQSPKGTRDTVFLSNYALLNIVDEMKRVPGVGDVTLFSPRNYSMRIWLRPDKLAQFGLTPGDVAAAIREQNAQYAAGRFGAEPIEDSTPFTYTVVAPARLNTPEAFGNIVLKATNDGAILRLSDVARVELGSQEYSFLGYFNGQPMVPIGIYAQPGANALDVTDAGRARLAELAKRFPADVVAEIPYDTTRFVRVSIEEVLKTFAEAMVLVVLVVFLFLQKFRATIIPLVAVPVSIIGTLAGLFVLGFSINLLTLFAMVLAIGIVVDDAIVVLENVERIMRTEGLGPRDAAIKAMSEVTGPIIAIVLVLCAVFVPVAFLGGLSGEMFRQFAVTIAISAIISGIVALTLTPALCALLLGHHKDKTGLVFRAFNRGFEGVTSFYSSGVAWVLRHGLVALVLVAAMVGTTWYLFNAIPSTLVPSEDKGYLLTVGAMPPSSSIDRTSVAARQVVDVLKANPETEGVAMFVGLDFLNGGLQTDQFIAFDLLTDWSKRTGPGQDADSLAGRFFGQTMGVQDAFVFHLNPPPLPGISLTGGVDFYIQDRSGGSIQALSDQATKLIAALQQQPEIASASTTFNAAVPRFDAVVNRDKAKALGIPLNTIFETLQATIGALYVNDFTLYGRNFQVNLQSEARFRANPEDLRFVFVRSPSGDMIPLDALVKIERGVGPAVLLRYNNFPGAKMLANPGPGYTSGQVMDAVERVAGETLDDGYVTAWVGTAFLERQAGTSASLAFIFGLVMVFLILAAQYERWTLPLAVLTAVPFALFGAIVMVFLRGIANDIYFQIGLVTLIGLSAKNAILIVEFAALRRRQGRSIPEAAMEAARQRFRPIVMTSFAFILGCVPLAISTGAGAHARHSIGTGVIGGMLAATLIATFFIPWFFTLIARLGERGLRRKPAAEHLPDPGE